MLPQNDIRGDSMDKRVVKVLAWYAKQPDVVQLQVHERQIELRRSYMNDSRRRGVKPDNSAVQERETFHRAVADVFRRQSDRRLSIYDDLTEVDKERIAQAKEKARRNAPKKEKLLAELRPVVDKLRSEGVSWQGVSDYLARHHKKRISRGYLQKVFAKL